MNIGRQTCTEHDDSSDYCKTYMRRYVTAGGWIRGAAMKQGEHVDGLLTVGQRTAMDRAEREAGQESLGRMRVTVLNSAVMLISLC